MIRVYNYLINVIHNDDLDGVNYYLIDFFEIYDMDLDYLKRVNVYIYWDNFDIIESMVYDVLVFNMIKVEIDDLDMVVVNAKRVMKKIEQRDI